MNWFTRLIKAVPKEERKGIHLDILNPFWEVEGPEDFVELFKAILAWIPTDAILYLEGGSPDKEIEDFMIENSVPEVSHLAIGTLWPRPKVYHLPATEQILNDLSMIMEHHAEPELAIHFHVYQKDEVLLEWHDAFSQPLLMSGSISEEKVKAFADQIGKKYKKIVEHACARDASSARP